MPVEPMELPDGRTVNTSPKFDIGRNFCNKLWNASRFALTNLVDMDQGDFDEATLTLEDRWILSRLADTTDQVTQQLTEFRFSDPVNLLYRFFWNELCDWYLELIKPRMRDEARRTAAQRVLAFVIDAAMRLLHPFMPFITEGIYQQLNALCPERGLGRLAALPRSEQLVRAAWPQLPESLNNKRAERDMQAVQEVIRQVRDIRTRYQIPPRKGLVVSVKAGPESCELLQAQQQLICDMAFLEALTTGGDTVKPDDAAVAVTGDLEIYIHGMIDKQAEQGRLLKQQEELLNNMKKTESKLGNEKFVTRAKPEIVQRERDRLAELQEQLATVEKNLADLE